MTGEALDQLASLSLGELDSLAATAVLAEKPNPPFIQLVADVAIRKAQTSRDEYIRKRAWGLFTEVDLALVEAVTVVVDNRGKFC